MIERLCRALCGSRRPAVPPVDQWIAAVRAIWDGYGSELQRAPDPEGLAQHLHAWATGTSLDAILTRIRESEEAARRRTPPPRPVTTLLEPLRWDGRQFVDRDGLGRLLVGTTLFWLAWGVRHDRARITRHLAWLADHGVDAVRALASVGPETWEDRTIDPAWWDYPEVIEEATMLAAAHGIRVIWTLFGGGAVTDDPAMRRRVVETVVATTVRHPHAVLYLEVINEGWNQRGWSPADAKAIADELVGRLPDHPVAVTAVDNPPSVWYQGSRATLATWHFDRWTGGEGQMWRPVRQPWEAQYRDDVPAGFVNQEPIGPGSSVASDNDPVRLAMAAVVTWVAGGAVHIVHSGAGIRGKEDVHPTAGRRPANLWEEPALPPTFRLITTIRARLPHWVPHGMRVNVGPGRPHPLSVDDLLPAIARHALLRAYATVRSPGGFVCAALDVRDEIIADARYPVTSLEMLRITPDGQLESSHGASLAILKPAATVVIGRE